jgi:hypothetical protein
MLASGDRRAVMQHIGQCYAWGYELQAKHYALAEIIRDAER